MVPGMMKGDYSKREKKLNFSCLAFFLALEFTTWFMINTTNRNGEEAYDQNIIFDETWGNSIQSTEKNPRLV